MYCREQEARDLGLGWREEGEQCEGVKDGHGGRRKSRSWIYRGDGGGSKEQSMYASCTTHVGSSEYTTQQQLHGHHLLTKKYCTATKEEEMQKDMEHKTLARILPKEIKG